jgi:hypothetical protein
MPQPQINNRLERSGYNFVRIETLHHYNRRDELSLSDMLSIAKSTVEMTGVSFTLLCRSARAADIWVVASSMSPAGL